MNFDTIRNDYYAIESPVLRRRVLRDLLALVEDLEIEEGLHPDPDLDAFLAEQDRQSTAYDEAEAAA